MLEELLAAAAGAGLAVREAVLTKYEVPVRSGLVVLRGEPVLFLDSGLPAAERIELLADALSRRDLEDVFLSPAARSLIEGARNQRTGSD